MWDKIQQQIQSAIDRPFPLSHRQAVGGGSINQAYRIDADQQTYFVKLNQANKIGMFEAEARGLQAIAETLSIRVPQVLCWGIADGSSYLVLEWIDLRYGGTNPWSVLGKHLASLHHHTSQQGFGWIQDNTIGDTSQPNPWCSDWSTFFTKHRIAHQLQLAQRRGGQFTQGQALLQAIPKLLYGHTPLPSLVHGDLWSGNAAFSRGGEPVVFDPAVYYGDREVDLAMTELFGGFPEAFYQGYQSMWPLAPGYAQRKVLYNLYHVLNHFNLFGGSYRHQAERMIDQILANC